MRASLLLAGITVLLASCHRSRPPSPDSACTPAWARYRPGFMSPEKAVDEWTSSAGVLAIPVAGAMAQGPTRGDFDVELTVKALAGKGASVDLSAQGGLAGFATAAVRLTGGRVLLDANTDVVNLDGSFPATLRLRRRGHRVTSTASSGGVEVTHTTSIEDDSLYVIVQVFGAVSAARLGPFTVASGADPCPDGFRAPLVIRGSVAMPSVLDVDAAAP